MAAVLPVISAIGTGFQVATLTGNVFLGVVAAVGSFALTGVQPDVPDSNMGDAKGIIVNTANPAENIPVVYGSRRVAGNRVFAETTNNDQYLHLVHTLTEGEVSALNTVYFNDKLSTDSRYSGLQEVNKHTGTDGQAADSNLVSRITAWTTDHKLSGTAYLYVRLKFDREAWGGLPNITCDVDGVKVYDPRDTLTKFSDNPALCIRDYLTNARYGRGIATSLIDDTTFIEAANHCDETVVIDEQNLTRYTLNGLIDTSRGVLDNLRAMLTSCRGMLVFSGGKYKLIIDKAEASVFAFNEDNMVGGWSIQLGDKSNTYNRIKASYFNPDRDWQKDAAIIDDTALRTADNGLLLEREIELPYTTNALTARMIAAINLKQSRQMITASFLSTVEGIRCEVGDVVTVTHSTPGWTNKQFRVMSLAIQSNDEVRVSVREYDADVYDWGTISAVDTTPNTNLPDPRNLTAPTGLAVSEAIFSARDGAGSSIKVTVTCDAHTSVFIETYRFEYRTVGGSWVFVADTPYNTVEILDVVADTYEFRVKAKSRHGGSEYSTTTKTITGAPTAVAAITGLRLNAISSLAYLQWDQHSDIGVRIGGSIQVRHSRKVTGASWAESTWIGEATNGIQTSATYPLKTGTYLARAVDSSGQVGAVSSVSTPGIQLLAWASTTQLAAHPNFSGTHQNTILSDGFLKLTGAALMDSWGLVDDVTNWDAGDGQFNQSGTYTFASGIDQGSVKAARLETDISVILVNTLNLMDDWGLVDDLEDWDGTLAASGDVKIEVRTTDDDPAGSPTWSAWENLVIGDYKNRAFEFRAQLTTTDPTYNTHVDEITITAREA